MEQGSGTGTGGKRKKKKKGTQEPKGDPRKDNIQYYISRNQLLELSQQDLVAMAEDDQHVSHHRFDNDLPEDEDDEPWGPEEEEYLADDWDIPFDSGFVDDQFSAPEPSFSLSGVSAAQVGLPVVVVEREHDITGVKLEVRLANAAALRTLISTWRQAGQRDWAKVLGDRMTWLLDVARYIVEQQKEFFLHRGPRRPLKEKQVAQDLWPGETLTNKKSRVSYLINGKALRAPWGEIIALTDLLPSPPDCLLNHICTILRDHDHVREVDGRRVVQSLIQVDSQPEDSIVKQLHRRLGRTDGLSPENVKTVMKRHNIPRVASERKVAYEEGKAWWIAMP